MRGKWLALALLAALPASAQWVNNASAWQQYGVVSGGTSVDWIVNSVLAKSVTLSAANSSGLTDFIISPTVKDNGYFMQAGVAGQNPTFSLLYNGDVNAMHWGGGVFQTGLAGALVPSVWLGGNYGIHYPATGVVGLFANPQYPTSQAWIETAGVSVGFNETHGVTVFHDAGAQGTLGTGYSAIVAGDITAQKLHVVTSPVYADNAAALAGGLGAGDVYRTATGVLMIAY